MGEARGPSYGLGKELNRESNTRADTPPVGALMTCAELAALRSRAARPKALALPLQVPAGLRWRRSASAASMRRSLTT